LLEQSGVTSNSTGDDLIAYNMLLDKMNVTITAPWPLILQLMLKKKEIIN
jgi:hypothetical protein